MQTYSIDMHGDALEKEAAAFIRQKFSQYELVWQMYIGHQGNGIKADMTGYSEPEKRDRFSEHTYTILESAYLIETIIRSGIFISPIDNITQYLEFNKSFITFFACLGRIKDNLERATACLRGGTESKKIAGQLDAFYQSRNVILHGCKIPFGLDDLKLIRIPVIFQTLGTPGRIWDDRQFRWGDYNRVHDEYASESIQDLFDALMKIVNTEFAHYKEYLIAHLKEEKATLAFSYNNSVHGFFPSGSTAVMITRTAVSSSSR